MPEPRYRTSSRLVLVAVIFLSIAPIQFKPEHFIDVSIDQFAAFAVLSLFLTLAYPSHRKLIAANLIVLPVVLEMLQAFEIGRNGSGYDVALKVAGVMLGQLIYETRIRLEPFFYVVSRQRRAIRDRHKRFGLAK